MDKLEQHRLKQHWVDRGWMPIPYLSSTFYPISQDQSYPRQSLRIPEKVSLFPTWIYSVLNQSLKVLLKAPNLKEMLQEASLS